MHNICDLCVLYFLTFRFFFKYPLIFDAAGAGVVGVGAGDEAADLIAGCFVVTSDLHTASVSGELIFAVGAFCGTVVSALDTTGFGCDGC